MRIYRSFHSRAENSQKLERKIRVSSRKFNFRMLILFDFGFNFNLRKIEIHWNWFGKKLGKGKTIGTNLLWELFLSWRGDKISRVFSCNLCSNEGEIGLNVTRSWKTLGEREQTVDRNYITSLQKEWNLIERGEIQTSFQAQSKARYSSANLNCFK